MAMMAGSDLTVLPMAVPANMAVTSTTPVLTIQLPGRVMQIAAKMSEMRTVPETSGPRPSFDVNAVPTNTRTQATIVAAKMMM
jgi:hypothetical protein